MDRVYDIIQEAVVKTIPKGETKCKKAKWLSEEALQIAEKRRKANGKGEKERYTHLDVEFQRIARRDKRAFLSDQCKKQNETMGKTRDLFKKMRDTKQTFHAKMGTIKDRNGMELTETEDTKNRWQEYTELYKKDLNDPDNYDGLKLNIQKMKIMASCPITSWQIDGETMETVTDFIFLGSKFTADSDHSHEIKRCLLLGRKAMTNLYSILKSKDISLPTKVHLVKAMVFPVIMYRCES